MPKRLRFFVRGQTEYVRLWTVGRIAYFTNQLLTKILTIWHNACSPFKGTN